MNRESFSTADKILAVNEALSSRAIPYAFGGAIARNYYAEPRLTVDVDLGIFLPPTDHHRVVEALTSRFPIHDADEVARVIARDGQVRLQWDATPLDLFFSYDPFHDSTASRTRRVPFANAEIPILSAEDVIVHKLLFNRPKDWRDIADILYSERGTIDLPYIRQWLSYFFPPDETKREDEEGRLDTRITLFRDLADSIQPYGGRERE